MQNVTLIEVKLMFWKQRLRCIFRTRRHIRSKSERLQLYSASSQQRLDMCYHSIACTP